MQPLPPPPPASLPPAHTCWHCRATNPPGVAYCEHCRALQPARWEYRIVGLKKGVGFDTGLKDRHTADLNALGLEGWELVAMTADGGAGTLGATTGHSLIFKRRVP